ncbi:MAG: hypothetical protein IJS15_07500, partial [Victivallales bacterium]|nr:hypothetical protein [Victivallales bacterium]
GVIVFLGTMLAGPSLKLTAGFFKWLFWGTTHYDRPQPIISPAKSMRVQNNFVEALDYLETIVASYPDLAVGYIEIMDIYATDLKDKDMTAKTYERGKRTVKGRDERRKLDAAYMDLMAE